MNLKKICFLGIFTTAGIILCAAESLTDCQMLWPASKQQELLKGRHNWNYMGRAGRLSEQSAAEGFQEKDPAKAIGCFNQSWRFNPDNPMAYWGAMIARGREGMASQDLATTTQALADSCKLGELATEKIRSASPVLQENFALDYALALAYYAAVLKTAKNADAANYFQKAADLLKPLADRSPDGTSRTDMVIERASRQLSAVFQEMEKPAEAASYLTRADERQKLLEQNRTAK